MITTIKIPLIHGHVEIVPMPASAWVWHEKFSEKEASLTVTIPPEDDDHDPKENFYFATLDKRILPKSEFWIAHEELGKKHGVHFEDCSGGNDLWWMICHRPQVTEKSRSKSISELHKHVALISGQVHLVHPPKDE